MRRCALWLPLLLALPCAAHADDRAATALGSPADERGQVMADAGPLLDLRLDPGLESQMSAAPAYGAAASATTDAAPPPSRSEAPFSLGIDINTRRDMGSSASRAAAEPEGPQTLGDKVEGVVRRSTFGVTGTYRF